MNGQVGRHEETVAGNPGVLQWLDAGSVGWRLGV
jgi:hypothetical protein